jgi:hypothetical protein
LTDREHFQLGRAALAVGVAPGVLVLPWSAGIFGRAVTVVLRALAADADMSLCMHAGEAEIWRRESMRSYRQFTFWVLVCMGITSLTYLMLVGN